MYRACTSSSKRTLAHALCPKMLSSVGFIGLGNMGAKMAANLVRKGTQTVVYDVHPSSVQELSEMGAATAASVKDLSSRCDTIITMLPATAHVEAVLGGVDGVFESVKPNTLIIDSSTIDPNASRRLHKQAQTAGARMIDAPVSGGVTGAASGTLTFMVGGAKEDFERAQHVLSLMGKFTVYCGDAGAGGVAKLCNNLCLAISMVGVSEAMALGIKLGMDPKVLAGVMNSSTASARGYTGGFGSVLMKKDLGLALDAANAVTAKLPLGVAAHEIFGVMCEQGYSGKDFSAVFDYISKLK